MSRVSYAMLVDITWIMCDRISDVMQSSGGIS